MRYLPKRQCFTEKKGKKRQTREIYLTYEAMARNQNMAEDGGAVKYLERPGFFVCCFDACILMWTSALY